MKIFKKSLAVLLCMITVFATMAIGFTASAVTLNPVVSVYVNNVELTNGKYLAVGGTKATTTKPSGGYAYFNQNKLYLNNYTFSLNDNKFTNGYGEKSRIYAHNGVLNIYFSGVNGLECNATTGYTSDWDIYCYRGKVELNGNHDAVISLSGKNYSVCATEGIWAEGGTYNLAKGFEASSPIVTTESTIFMRNGVFNVSEYGHKAYGYVNIANGIHNFNCPNGYAVTSDTDNVIISGGTINSTSGGFLTKATGSQVSISGGRINLTAKPDSYGISTKSIKMTDGYLKVTSDYRAVNAAFENIPSNISVTASTNQNGSGAGAFNASTPTAYKYVEAKSSKTYDLTIDSGLGATTTKAYYNESIGAEAKTIAGKKFTKWTLKGVYLPIHIPETAKSILFTMPKNAVTVTANYETDTTTPVNGKNITVINGKAAASKALPGTIVAITANEIPGKKFDCWSISGAKAADMYAKETYFEMGNSDVIAEAVYSAAKYTVTVTNGVASAPDATVGTVVTITANQINGKVFKYWEVNGATVADKNAKETTFTMGNAAVTAEAVYEDCDCQCHTGNFFFKIILFFQKLFGMNKVCEGCGAKH